MVMDRITELKAGLYDRLRGRIEEWMKRSAEPADDAILDMIGILESPPVDELVALQEEQSRRRMDRGGREEHPRH